MNIVMSSLLAMNFSVSAEAITNRDYDQRRERIPAIQQTLAQGESDLAGKNFQWNAVARETGYRQFVIQVFGPRGYNMGSIEQIRNHERYARAYGFSMEKEERQNVGRSDR